MLFTAVRTSPVGQQVSDSGRTRRTSLYFRRLLPEPLDALLTPADNIVVLEILEEVSPWYDRSLGITAADPA